MNINIPYNVLYLFEKILIIICTLFLFIQIEFFFKQSYIISGDFYHGIGSSLLILHSSLASICNLIFYLVVILICLNKYLEYKSFNTLLVYVKINLYILTIFGLYMNVIFISTGFIWGDYSWGNFYSIEYHLIKLLLIIGFYLLFILQYKYNNTYVNYMSFFIFFVYCLIVTVNNLKDYFPILFNLINSDFHQNDETLHIFLISVSGSYLYHISISIIYVMLCIYCYFNVYYNIHISNNTFR